MAEQISLPRTAFRRALAPLLLVSRWSRAVTALTMTLTVAGVTIAALGQAITTRDVPDRLGWLAFLADDFKGIFIRNESVAAAIVLLTAGAILFTLAAARRPAAESSRFALAPVHLDPRTWRSTKRVALLGVGAIGLALFGFILLHLRTQPYQHWVAMLVPVAVALIAVPFLARDLGEGSLRVRFTWPMLAEAGFLAAVVGTFIALNVSDLTNWKYSAIGDEYAGYFYASGIADGTVPNPFSQRLGAWGISPPFDHILDAAFLKAFGGDLFAWKLRVVVMSALALIPFYLLVRELFSSRVAMIATALTASSHYIYAYVHHPPHIGGLFPTTLSLWLLVVGLKRGSMLALFAGGLAAGLGFHSAHYTGRAVIAVIALYLVTSTKSLRPTTLVPLGLGFILLTAPLFAVDGWYIIDRMFNESAVNYDAGVVGSRVTRFLHNIIRTAVAFNYGESARHYVSGSLLDPVTAVLYVLGIGVVLSRLRHPAFRFVAVWWLVALAFMGFTSPYPAVPISRLHVVVPVAALLAALAFDHGLRSLLERLPWRGLRFAAPGVALGLLLVPVLFLNLHRFWYETPHEAGAETATAVAVRAFFSDACRDHPQGVTITAAQTGPLLRPVFVAYDLGEKSPALLNYPNLLSALDARQASGAPLKDGCFIIVASGDRPELPGLVAARIQAVYPQKQLSTVTDLAGNRPVTLIHDSAMASAQRLPR